MIELDDFINHALAVGKGRDTAGRRQIPGFVPGGDGQDRLFDQTLACLLRQGFHLFDLRGPKAYENSLNSFPLNWPVCSNQQLERDAYSVAVEEQQDRLIIVCGQQHQPRFWRHLRNSSALHVGAAFPPFMEPTTKCVLVPDAACVCALVKDRDFGSLPNGYLAPAHRYTTEKAVWLD